MYLKTTSMHNVRNVHKYMQCTSNNGETLEKYAKQNY